MLFAVLCGRNNPTSSETSARIRHPNTGYQPWQLSSCVDEGNMNSSAESNITFGGVAGAAISDSRSSAPSSTSDGNAINLAAVAATIASTSVAAPPRACFRQRCQRSHRRQVTARGRRIGDRLQPVRARATQVGTGYAAMRTEKSMFHKLTIA